MISIIYNEKQTVCIYCGKCNGAFELKLFKSNKQINKKYICKKCFNKLTYAIKEHGDKLII